MARKITPEQAGNLVAYLLMRDDLPSLGRGKALAHAMHAGNHMTHHLEVEPLRAKRRPDPRMAAWSAQGGGFGTAMAVGEQGRMDEARLRELVAAAEAMGHLGGVVVDGTYPYLVDREVKPLIREDVHTMPPRLTREGWICFREETTCAWIMGDKEGLAILMARYGLVPND